MQAELERTAGSEVAIISRSGLDLSRFALRYSHGGFLLAAGTDVPWSVRQLYYDCRQGYPRLYDQGLAGYLLSAEAPDLAFVSVVLLPYEAAASLRAAALDTARAARLLASTYSANAYPFSTRYQNCNQWTAELLASAWGELADGPDLRARAQAWLAANGYDPEPVDVGSYLVKIVASLMPLIHLDDHPHEVRAGLRFQFSLPQAIESFVRARFPDARRLEFCHDSRRIVVREGWEPLGSHCVPAAGDRTELLAQ